MTVHFRKQYSVGQGFFHAASLSTGKSLADPEFLYVYDCGAMGRYRPARNRSIDAFIRDTSPREIDILFLSHMHADHINGLSRLLHRSNGKRADTIVLPLVDDFERIVAFSQAVANDESARLDSFYRRFVIDPESALRQFDPRQIIFVRKGGGEFDPGIAPDRPPPMKFDDDGPGGRSWSLKFPNRFSRAHENVGAYPRRRYKRSPSVFIIGDDNGLSLPSYSSWVLLPYVDPSIKAYRDRFTVAAKNILGITKREFSAAILDKTMRRDLVVNKAKLLARAYSSLESDINLTSLCLYSGPMMPSEGLIGCRKIAHGLWWGSKRPGWLATGDADLRKPSRLSAFLEHYKNVLRDAGSLTLPHHGSAKNFNEGLLQGIYPEICVVAADAYSNWSHPDLSVVRAVSSSGSQLGLVTSDENTQLSETYYS